MNDDVEEFTVKLPRNLVEAFRAVAANNGEDLNLVAAQLIQTYVESHKDSSLARVSGVIEVYVKSLLNQWMDWAPAKELEADEFIELTVGEIHKKLVVNSDQAKKVAFRIWQELRIIPGQGENIAGEGNTTDDHGTGQDPAGDKGTSPRH